VRANKKKCNEIFLSTHMHGTGMNLEIEILGYCWKSQKEREQ
jgi:hypothetical protein